MPRLVPPAAHRPPRPRARRLGATICACAVGAGMFVVGCGSTDSARTSSAARGTLDVVASTTQLADFAREVGGADVDVHQILRPNTDPHEYEPRPSDVKAAAEAAVVLRSGNGLDDWMTDIVERSGADPTQITIAPEHTPVKVAGEPEGDEASRYDPHWWHDPRNVEAAVAAIRDAFAQADPAARATFAANASAYLAKLHALDRGIAACFARIPAGERKLVTSHDAFGYFANRYGITVVGAAIPSQSTMAQPSAGEIAKLVDLVERNHVRAIFPESSINPRLVRALARETGASADHTLYGDTLGPAGSAGDTYLKMERANADAMVRGFTGEADRCVIDGL